MQTTQNKKTIEKSIEIAASREAIWSALIDKDSFSDWGSSFMPGSYYEGEWAEGNTIRFLGPCEDRGTNGMITKVAEYTYGEYVRAEHIGIVTNGEDVYEGDVYDMWIPATEEYRLTGGPDRFTLHISNEVPEGFFDEFSEAWDKSLVRIKEIATKGQG